MKNIIRTLVGALVIAVVFIAQGSPSTNLMYEPEKPKNLKSDWRKLKITR